MDKPATEPLEELVAPYLKTNHLMEMGASISFIELHCKGPLY